MPGHARPKTSPRGTRRLLSLLVRIPLLSLILFFSPCSPPSKGGGDPRALPPFSLSPRNSARLAGVMPARSSACTRASCTALSGGWKDEQWLCFASTLLSYPSSPSSFPRNDQDLPMIFNAGSATSTGPHVGVA